tara:strand:+ start:1776 stop:2507 length:732 start_codon:yes stop_codon:yes gene_type:complete
MINTNLILNVYEGKSLKSALSTQLLYGDKFKIIKKFGKFTKIKTTYDNYIGYIKNKKFKKKFTPTHKISSLSANLYSRPNKKFKLNKKISFCSFIKINDKKKNFLNFDKYWIKKKDVLPIKKKILFSKIKMFKNIKYKWGGNSFKGIDCSALVQIFYKFNNKFCPRDTKDQIKYFKKNIKIGKIKKNNLIFWKGHVAVCLSKKNLIHAYGPKKKVIIMNTIKTINEIEKKSNLKVQSIKNESI